MELIAAKSMHYFYALILPSSMDNLPHMNNPSLILQENLEPLLERLFENLSLPL